MELAVEALRNGHIGLNAASLVCPLQNDAGRDRGEKVILQRKTFKLLPKWSRLTVLQLEHCVLCTAITGLRSLASKGSGLNHFPDTPNKDGYRCGFTRRHSQLSPRQPHARRSPGRQVSVKTVSVNCAVAVWLLG